MRPINVISSVLLEVLESLPARAIITKNKVDEARGNFRADGKIADRYFDGFWRGEPRRIAAGEAFCLHFEERNSCLWIGRYSGTQREANGTVSLIVDEVQAYKISDWGIASEAQNKLHAILKKPSAVTYSYQDPKVVAFARNTVPIVRMAWIRQRIEQAAFRERVFALHGKKCKVTGCHVPTLLEAAHLKGRDWRLGHNNGSDGIPLRVDIHRAYDAGLLTLNEQHQLVELHEDLMIEYSKYLP
ncbi:HNH endonuclease signature motif containing protein [Herbaspirillum huttiense]|uniref:HNH endonuclease signature motif containing protein n=1 Tax=Herbaspirillum huttiense subsp. lycopersici TaxID=3074428 RepID=A0ABU2ETM6_9BURK|nr:HNH endonuclease signature motif containing protein [Herbaspirillum huttiense]MDR9851148.1 HNH endonuclease signature motif containing protein [Herbaspirillum huttiense SE1]